MLKLKFWQRIYLSTLLLLLIAVTIIICIIGYSSHQQYANAVIDQARASHTELERTISFDIYRKQQAAKINMHDINYQSFKNYYKTDTQFLFLTENNEIKISTFSKEYEKELLSIVKNNNEDGKLVTIGDTKYLILTKGILSSNIPLNVTYIQEFSSVEEAWQEQLYLSLAVGVSVSTILLISLWFVIRKFTRPLEQINDATNQFALGNYDIRLLIKQKDELGELADSFNNMATTIEENMHQLEKSSIQKQEMINNIAHEIRTPLTNIQGYGELLLNARMGKKQKYEMINIIIKESHKLKVLSSKMLELAYLQSNRLEQEEVNLVEIIKEAMLNVENKCKDKNITINLTIKNNVVINGDDILLQSLFTNLLDNAINSMDKLGQIEVVVDIGYDKAFIEITDQGIGMTQEQLEQLGNPFYRIDKSRSRRLGGHGLGVSLCYQIVHQHNGEISYDSKKGVGTKVRIKFNKDEKFTN